jgi:hypothetical protein
MCEVILFVNLKRFCCIFFNLFYVQSILSCVLIHMCGLFLSIVFKVAYIFCWVFCLVFNLFFLPVHMCGMFSYSIFKVSCLVLCSIRLLNIVVVKLHLKVQAKKNHSEWILCLLIMSNNEWYEHHLMALYF